MQKLHYGNMEFWCVQMKLFNLLKMHFIFWVDLAISSVGVTTSISPSLAARRSDPRWQAWGVWGDMGSPLLGERRP